MIDRAYSPGTWEWPDEKPLKLSLGAGTQKEDDYLSVDYLDIPEVDCVWNLLDMPYPFSDESADEIKMIDVLEHLPSTLPDGKHAVIEVIKECHRILKSGCTLTIQVPHADSPNTWTDLTHTRGYTERSMNYFDPTTDLGKHYGYYSDVKFSVHCTITNWRDPDTGISHVGNCVFTMAKL